MKDTIISLGIAVLISGCSTQGQEPTFVQDQKYCDSIGAVTPDQRFQCRMMLEQRRESDANRSATSSAALLAAGSQILSQPQPPVQPVMPTRTTCNRYGNRVVCNTF